MAGRVFENDVADGFHAWGLGEFVVQPQKRELLHVHMEIAEHEIVDIHPGALFGVFGVDVDRHVAVVTAYAVELTVFYLAAADAYSDGVGIVTLENAVRHRDPFARPRMLQSGGASPERERVVADADVAVGDDDPAAAVEVDPVVFGYIRRVADVDAADIGVGAAEKVARPAGRVFDVKVADPDVSAFAEEHHLRRAPLFALPLRSAHEGVHDRVIPEDVAGVAVDATAADENIFLLQRDDEVLTAFAAAVVVRVLRAEVLAMVVCGGGAGDKDRVRCEFQAAVAAQKDAARAVGPAGEVDRTSGIDGFLDGGGVVRDTVADRSEVSDVVHASRSPHGEQLNTPPAPDRSPR